jgi:GNAT superfamily N-acetyltransferase
VGKTATGSPHQGQDHDRRTGQQGEFGGAIVVRPTTADETRNPRGHILAGGATCSYSHYYALQSTSCDIWEACGSSRHHRPYAGWCEIDPVVQHDATTAPTSALFSCGCRHQSAPPSADRNSTRRQTVDDVDLVLCPWRKICPPALCVDSERRRRGYGRALVVAALTLGSGSDWSTTAINETIEARAFWASVGLPGPGIPAFCTTCGGSGMHLMHGHEGHDAELR